MIDIESLLIIPYGMYAVCSGNKEYGNGFIATVVFQATAEPVQIGVCCHKNNHTAELIQKHGVFSVSILPENTSMDIIRTFGYRSGKDNNKMEQREIAYGYENVPILKENVVAYMTCKLVKTVDVGTHFIFIGELMELEKMKNEKVMTYTYYREVMKGKSPKYAPTFINKSKI